MKRILKLFIPILGIFYIVFHDTMPILKNERDNINLILLLGFYQGLIVSILIYFLTFFK